MKRYLPVNVYTCPQFGDCSNKGVTLTHRDQLLVPCPDGHVTQEDVDYRARAHYDPYVILEVGEAGGAMHFRAPNPSNRWLMFGGNYVMGDSRFSKLYGNRPVPVHDRIE